MVAYKLRCSITQLILTLGAGWRSVVNITPRPLYLRGKTTVHIEQDARWGPETVRMLFRRHKPPPVVFEQRTVHPAAYSLYLHYPEHIYTLRGQNAFSVKSGSTFTTHRTLKGYKGKPRNDVKR